MITDEKMEKLIAELYEESIQEMEVPVDIDVEAHLDRAYRELEAKEKEKAAAARKIRFRRAVRAAVVFIGVLVLSLAVFEPEQGYADVFRFMFDRDARGNEVISDNLIGNETAEDVVELMVTLDELDEVAGFHVPMPTYLPEGYRMKFGVNIIKGYEKAISLYCSYVKMEGQGIIMYTIMPAEDKRVTSIVMDISEEDIEEATINNNLYYIYTDEEKARIAVYWETEEFMYSIDGNITEEEAIRIVESIE